MRLQWGLCMHVSRCQPIEAATKPALQVLIGRQRVMPQKPDGCVSRGLKQSDVGMQVRMAKHLNTALPLTEQLTWSTQLQVFLGQREAVIRVANGQQPRTRHFRQRRREQ